LRHEFHSVVDDFLLISKLEGILGSDSTIALSSPMSVIAPLARRLSVESIDLLNMRAIEVMLMPQ